MKPALETFEKHTSKIEIILSIGLGIVIGYVLAYLLPCFVAMIIRLI